MEKKKILITGAAGFIGSQLAKFIHLYIDCNLVLVDNLSYGTEDNLVFDGGIDLRQKLCSLDITSYGSMEGLFKKYGGFDYIYNIAGIAPLPDCQSNPIRAFETNTIGVLNLLELSRKYGCNTFVQASTNAMYENVDMSSGNAIDEDALNNDNLPTLIYPNTKYCAEQICRSYANTYRMNVCCVRFANVYGPHIDCTRKMPPFVAYMIRELYYNRVPVFHSDGNQRRDYIYSNDLIRLLWASRKTIGYNYVNASSGESYSVRELYSIVKQIMNKDIEPVYIDSSHYWDKYPELKEGKFTIDKQVLDHEVNKTTKCSYENASLCYNWSPEVKIREGLKKVVEDCVHRFRQADGDPVDEAADVQLCDHASSIETSGKRMCKHVGVMVDVSKCGPNCPLYVATPGMREAEKKALEEKRNACHALIDAFLDGVDITMLDPSAGVMHPTSVRDSKYWSYLGEFIRNYKKYTIVEDKKES